ncbi:hypothetical protein AOLI_G00203490 [Acnodon oligacanthus]
MSSDTTMVNEQFSIGWPPKVKSLFSCGPVFIRLRGIPEACERPLVFSTQTRQPTTRQHILSSLWADLSQPGVVQPSWRQIV